ncbi:hypothetical protein [Clostridium vincentii]|uniref:Lipoprotein n=1 Tax=Clostridium vincentii TaxID=52704 RepID=A0A2T0B8S9_9CLOT|nr:hypothetical protein [Clostridium vincentii]PRR80299.1 hypothetical protein CLVI_30890 [Clostridium vincentii]
MGRLRKTFALAILMAISFTLISCNSGKSSETSTKIEVKETISKSIEKEEFNIMLSNLDENLFKSKADISVDGDNEDYINFIVDVNANGETVAYAIARYYYEQVIALNKETITDENKDKVRMILRTGNEEDKAWMYEGKNEINLLN